MRPVNEKLAADLLEAGKQEFLEKGFQGASMRGIASRLSVTTGALYRYYTDKELAVKLKVSRRSLQDYRNNGILPYTQVGGKILYRASDIEGVLMDGYKEAYRLKKT